MTEMRYEQMLEHAVQFIRSQDDFVVVSHVNPDGDAISSTCAVGWLLDRLGKSYVLVNEDVVPPKFDYLAYQSKIATADSDVYAQASKGAIISVDCADFSRIGAPSHQFPAGIPMLNIDHHPTNDHFGTASLIQPTAAATCEILFELIQAFGFSLDREIANTLYTGLMTDTGGFRYANTTPGVMQIAADLLAAGAQGAVLSEKLLESMTYSQLDLLRRSLNQLQFSEDRRLAWMVITTEDIQETHAVNSDLEGLVNYARNVEGVEVGVLFKQVNEETYKLSMRSAGLVDVAKVAKMHGGGGHHRAAGVTMQGNLADIQARLFATLTEELN
jgi:phosphoesterase RecJ-like protein